MNLRRHTYLTVLILACIVANCVAAMAQTDRETLRWLNTHPRINEIVIDGNTYFSDDEIRAQLFSQKWNWFRDGLFKDRRNAQLQRETIIRDTAQVKGLYLKSGFLNVQISEQFIRLPGKDSSARIEITIVEGQQYHLFTAGFSGEYPDDARNDIRNYFKRLRRGDPVNIFALHEVRVGIKEVMANHGFPFAEVSYELDTARHVDSVVARYLIRPDSLVTFGSVSIEGDNLYGEGTVRREVDIDSGETYQRKAIQESLRHLLRSGYYTNANIYALDSASDPERYEKYNPDFRVSVREREAYFFNARAGVLSDSLRDLVSELQVVLGKRNFLRSRRLEAQANGLFAFEGQFLLNHRYRLRFVEPWFLGLRMPLSLSGEFEPGVSSVLQPYKIQRWRLDAQTLWEIGLTRRIIFGAQYESVKIFDISDADAIALREAEGISVRRKLYASWLSDTRDDIFVPKHGTLIDVKGDFYGGFLSGDAHFTKLEASWAKYQPFWKSIIRATRIKFGWAEPLHSDKIVPSLDRFYIGGANSIRGFATEELPQPASPGGFSPGALFYVIFNQELRFPLAGKFWGSAFFDAGNGWQGLDDPNISFEGAAYSYGAGIQYLSPAGPLRLDYARRIKTEGIANVEAQDYRFHFTILYAF